jgi:hypothetical protein
VCWLFLVPVAGFAASGEDFYLRLYQRGMAHFAAGDYATAFTELRNAAFGFVERVDTFETAQSYAVIAAHRLGHDSDARESLLRIVSAEKIQPHFRSVTLPDDMRAEIDTVAATLLTSQECTLLGVPAKVQEAAATKPAVVVPTPTKAPNVAVTAPRERESREKERPDETQPKTTPQPVTPAPQPRVVAPQPVAPQPVAPQPVAQPVVPQPDNPKPADPAPKPPPAPAPQPVTQPKPQTTPPKPQPAAKNTNTSLAEAQKAIDEGDLGRARSIYDTLLGAPDLSHAAALRIAEGSYSVHDFAGTTRAFQRAGALNHGEEQLHYDYAVALYETGRYAEAKRELAASLPYITMTADVVRYRAKIEGAIE